MAAVQLQLSPLPALLHRSAHLRSIPNQPHLHLDCDWRGDLSHKHSATLCKIIVCALLVHLLLSLGLLHTDCLRIVLSACLPIPDNLPVTWPSVAYTSVSCLGIKQGALFQPVCPAPAASSRVQPRDPWQLTAWEKKFIVHFCHCGLLGSCDSVMYVCIYLHKWFTS